MADLSVFQRIKSKEDFDRERADFEMKKQMAQAQLLNAQKASSGPASLQEWAAYTAMSPEDQARYLQMKRADQIMNLGGSMAVRSPTGGIQEVYSVTPGPESLPEFKQAQAEASTIGADVGRKRLELGERVSGLPQLEETTKKLSELGKNATYTTLGKAGDVVRNELGLFGVKPSEGAVARTEYMSLVDNQILPLLRQTFGAAFTAKEGESLRATLGDPNATPEQKDATLRSFIEQKKATISSLQRELNIPQITEGDLNARQPKTGGSLPPASGMTPPEMARPTDKMSIEETVFNAKKAIKAGKSKDAIRQRLIEAGIDPARAGL